jgi:hypothetical protein
MRTATVHFHNKLDVFHGSFQVSICVTAANTLDRLGFGVGEIPSGPVLP